MADSGQQQQYSNTQEREHEDAPITASKTIDPDKALLAEAVTIDRPARELFEFWRDPTNLVQVMENVESIEAIDRDRSRWTVKGPLGKRYSWESVITHEVPDEEITWQSAQDAEIENNGRVQFIDAGARGTIVRAVIAYDPPGGKVGQLIGKVLQREPRIQTRRDLHRLKQLMETGEIATGARNRREQKERNEQQSAEAQQ